MSVWLFQANKDQYDLVEKVSALSADWWCGGRYRKQLRLGDVVLLWQSAPDAGVYATGILSTAAYDASPTEWRVDVEYGPLLDTPVLKADLISHPILHRLAVVRLPFQENPFKVTEDEWNALRALIGDDGTQHADTRRGIEFSDVLRAEGIDPKNVLVLRHSPREKKLRDELPRLAAERPDLFNAYQQTQSQKVEPRMVRADYVASFIGHEPGKATFVGLYSNNGKPEPLNREEFWAKPANLELRSLGMKGFTADDSRPSVLWFDLVKTDFHADWRGKLIVAWPPKELNWHRFASQCRIPILVIPQSDSTLPEEIVDPGRYVEGAASRIWVNAYERNPKAREVCLEHYGYSCSVCGFSFAEFYGKDIGEGYIHVHHLKDLASVGTEYQVDPIADLRPVCPNCHAMLHRKSKTSANTISIEALRDILDAKRSTSAKPK